MDTEITQSPIFKTLFSNQTVAPPAPQTPQTASAPSFYSNVGGLIKEGFNSYILDPLRRLAGGEVSPLEIAKNIPHAVSDVFGLNNQIIQAPLRTATRIGLSGIQALTGQNQDVTLSPIMSALFGTDKLTSYQTASKEGSQTIQQLGGTPTQQKFLPPAFLAIGSILDFTPFGEEKNAITQLAKEGTEEGVAKILNTIKGLDPEVITRLAPQIAKTTDKTEIKALLDVASEESSKLRLAKESAMTGLPRGVTKPLVDSIVPSTSEQISQTLANDARSLGNSQVLNLRRLDISDAGKTLIQDTAESVKPALEALSGTTLTNDEVLNLADRTQKMFKTVVDRQTTAEWESANLNLRRKLASLAESNTADKEFIDTLLAVKTRGTDIARKLQSFAIEAKPLESFSKQAILEGVLKVTQNADEIIAAAKGVDFSNLTEATNFYRKFVQPNLSEWVDLVRYNSMLSSPLTNIVNTFSNAIQSTVVAPLEKLTVGGVDFLRATLTGTERKAVAGEAGAYLQGYFKNIGEASQRFADVMTGAKGATNLDLRAIPLAAEGAKGAVVKTLSVPMKLLEASDQFFTALTQGAEKSALEYRQSKGIAVKGIEALSTEKATYRLFRQELFNKNQGHLLDAIDHVTSLIGRARNSSNKIVSTIAKFTLPFIQTPMNIFKQGLEYSPVGFATVFGAANKTEQVSKALIGSAVFAASATMLASGRLTWAEPTNADDKAAFRAAGMQAYSVKVGDHWVSFQKLPPAVSFPLALVAALDDLQKTRSADDDFITTVLKGVAKYGSFLADQSYMKSIGDLVSAAKGDATAVQSLISNYPQQLIPFRALGGWLARLQDATQRKVDTGASFVDKQMQLLMMNFPFLSEKTPARLDAQGNPIPNQNRVFNAFSPARATTENPELKKLFDTTMEVRGIEKANTDKAKKDKQNFQSTYEKIRTLVLSGQRTQAEDLYNTLSDAQKETFKSIKTSDTRIATNKSEIDIFPVVKQVRELVKSGNQAEAERIYNGLSDDQKSAFIKMKNRLY